MILRLLRAAIRWALTDPSKPKRPDLRVVRDIEVVEHYRRG